MKKLDALALALAIVGALNWGLVALAEFDLVAKIAGLEFGQTNGFTRVIYGLVGLSAVYLAVRFGELVARDGPRDGARDRLGPAATPKGARSCRQRWDPPPSPYAAHAVGQGSLSTAGIRPESRYE